MYVPTVSGWDAERGRAEQLARAEVLRLEALLACTPRGSGQGQRVAAEVGRARHKVRLTLSLREFVVHLRTTNPARYQLLLRESGPPSVH